MNGWLPRKGLVDVDRYPCPDYGTVDLKAPAKGILHTTEGNFESALSVFRQHFAPHFLVGRDKSNRVRVLQLVELGRVAGALEHHGVPETNSVCRVQIEIVGFSQKKLWLPDDGVTDALSRLMALLAVEAGIPLRHPRVGRDPEKWTKATGWLGHADVPENAHWDPGALRYTRLFQRANAYLAEQPDPIDQNTKRLTALRSWILKRRHDGWSWSRIKSTHNWAEFKRRHGK